jgi:hypothetical protein
MQANKSETQGHPAKAPPSSPPRERPARPAAATGLVAASDAVRAFFVNELKAHEVRITRIGASTAADAAWEAEAEILVPDMAIMTLGLELTQEVLERQRYSVHLDRALAVTSYGQLEGDE